VCTHPPTDTHTLTTERERERGGGGERERERARARLSIRNLLLQFDHNRYVKSYAYEATNIYLAVCLYVFIYPSIWIHTQI
jgi:hypothetical protein